MWLLLFFIALIAFMWFTGGGWAKIKAAAPRYTNPVQRILQGTSSTGMQFNVPGTPSSFPSLNVASSTGGGIDQPPATVVHIQVGGVTNTPSSDNTNETDTSGTSSAMGPIVPVKIVH